MFILKELSLRRRFAYSAPADMGPLEGKVEFIGANNVQFQCDLSEEQTAAMLVIIGDSIQHSAAQLASTISSQLILQDSKVLLTNDQS